MKIKFETADIVSASRMMNPELDFDSAYTFYYDETNNVKKIHLTSGDFNAPYQANFILGGMLYTGDRPDTEGIIPGLKLQKTSNEIKFNYIAHGEFEDCLKSDKLNYFLSWIENSPFYVHFSSLNILYFSLVDIVDSAIDFDDDVVELDYQKVSLMKNSLYVACKEHMDKVIFLFNKFEYPNVEPARVEAFLQELISFLDACKLEGINRIGAEMLKFFLRKAKRNKLMPLIKDEESHVLLKDLYQFYFRPIYTFKNSLHIIDKESSVEEAATEIELSYNSTVLTNYRFEDSKTDRVIQFSDVFVGLVGRFTKFINTNSEEKIMQKIGVFNKKQVDTLDLYLRLVGKSGRKNEAFFHSFNAPVEMYKNHLVFEARGLLY